jgi:hypothetical protein
MPDAINVRPIRGVKAIAAARNEPVHRTYRGLSLGHIRGFKEGGIWHWRPETQAAEYDRLEEEARLAAEKRRGNRAPRYDPKLRLARKA